MPFLCFSVHFCHSCGQCCIRSVFCFKQTCVFHCSLFISHRRERALQQGLTQWKQGSNPECCTCSDIETGILKANLKYYCKDKDEASEVFSVSHNPAIIIPLYANAEQVGNYSRACFTLLVLPDLGLKHNSVRIHIKYRAKPRRWALNKGLCCLSGQGLWRAMQERCHFRKLSGTWAVSFWRGRHMRSCVSTVCVQTRRWGCSLRDNSLSPGFVKLFSAVAFWGYSPGESSFLGQHPEGAAPVPFPHCIFIKTSAATQLNHEFW